MLRERRLILDRVPGQARQHSLSGVVHWKNRPAVRLFFLIPLLHLVLAEWVHADPGPQSLAAGEEAIVFQEIPSVYGASKFEQKITEAPSFVSLITSDEIRKYGYRSLAEILQSVTGIFVTYDRNYNYVGIRGFNRPGDFNTLARIRAKYNCANGARARMLPRRGASQSAVRHALPSHPAPRS